MKQRIRRPGPNGDINNDVDLGPGQVLRSSLAAANVRTLPEAIGPKKEHLMFINQENAAKQDPDKVYTFRGPIK